MSYVDGFLLAVKTARKADYVKVAAEAGAIFKEYGALAVIECWGDDVPAGKLTSMPDAVRCGADETVVFSWVVWPSKAVRDAGNAKLVEDPRMQVPADSAITDSQRMIFGGFVPIVEL